jgi:hypothetical protein
MLPALCQRQIKIKELRRSRYGLSQDLASLAQRSLRPAEVDAEAAPMSQEERMTPQGVFVTIGTKYQISRPFRPGLALEP